ncbi:MAG: hypothetical protein ABI655_14375 [Phenylobacterium sp.]
MWLALARTANVFVLVATAFALWRGGLRERMVAAVALVSWAGMNAYWVFPHLIAPLLGPYGGWRPARGQGWFELVTDVAILAICLACALRSDRYWTIWASSFALLSVVMHLVRPLASGTTL